MAPVLSLVTPCFRSNPIDLKEILGSLKPYQDLVEWVLVNDEPNNSDLARLLEELNNESFVRLYTNPENLGMFEAYRVGFEVATGDWVAILDHDDRVHPELFVDKLRSNLNAYDLVYTDEYKFEYEGVIKEIFRKPYFDPLSSLHYFYTHHFTFLKGDIVKSYIKDSKIERYPSCFDLWLNANYIMYFVTEKREIRWALIPELAYGWRIHQNSTAFNIQAVRPSQLGERLDLFVETFNKLKLSAVSKIDSDVVYLVDATFNHEFYEFTRKCNLGISGCNSISFLYRLVMLGYHGYKFSILGNLTEQIAHSLIRIFAKLPLSYLFQVYRGPFAITTSKEIHLLLKKDARLSSHPNGVPYVVNIDYLEVINSNAAMLFVFNELPNIGDEESITVILMNE